MAQLSAANAIVFPDRTMQPAFRDFLRLLESNLPIKGEGPPEGVVTAELYTLYLDTTGTAGNIEYRKMLPDIAGDTSMGWLAV